jgi:hypothetical protein
VDMFGVVKQSGGAIQGNVEIVARGSPLRRSGNQKIEGDWMEYQARSESSQIQSNPEY